MMIKTQCPWCVHAQKISEYCYGCYQENCNYEYKGIGATLLPCDDMVDAIEYGKEHIQKSLENMVLPKDFADRFNKEKKMKIVKTALVCGSRNFFIQDLQEAIDNFQNESLEVEVQFKTDEEGFYVLVIGRKNADT